MKIVFLGTPISAVASLRALRDDGHQIVGVVTPPPRRRGRGSALSPTPVHAAADESGLTVWHDLNVVAESGADLGVVVAYGAMIKKGVLDAVPMVNVHFSLLPRWRGAAPVERAILAGDQLTGVCVMGLEANLDTGPIYARTTTPVGEKTSEELLEELAQLGASLLGDTLRYWDAANPEPQSGEATYAHKLTVADFALSLTDDAASLTRRVRLGRAFCMLGESRLRVRSARYWSGGRGAAGSIERTPDGIVLTSDAGSIELVSVQSEGARALPAAEWFRGRSPRGEALVWH